MPETTTKSKVALSIIFVIGVIVVFTSLALSLVGTVGSSMYWVNRTDINNKLKNIESILGSSTNGPSGIGNYILTKPLFINNMETGISYHMVGQDNTKLVGKSQTIVLRNDNLGIGTEFPNNIFEIRADGSKDKRDAVVLISSTGSSKLILESDITNTNPLSNSALILRQDGGESRTAFYNYDNTTRISNTIQSSNSGMTFRIGNTLKCRERLSLNPDTTLSFYLYGNGFELFPQNGGTIISKVDFNFKIRVDPLTDVGITQVNNIIFSFIDYQGNTVAFTTKVQNIPRGTAFVSLAHSYTGSLPPIEFLRISSENPNAILSIYYGEHFYTYDNVESPYLAGKDAINITSNGTVLIDTLVKGTSINPIQNDGVLVVGGYTKLIGTGYPQHFAQLCIAHPYEPENFGWIMGNIESYSDANNNLGFISKNRTGYNIAGFIDESTSYTMLNFTGQHRCFVEGYSYDDLKNMKGLIVSANNNCNQNMSNGLVKGKRAITINESLPIVSLSKKRQEKSVFGVISDAEDPERRTDRYGAFCTPYDKQKGDTRVYVNSVGEGAIWVCDINGSLESGDYITSSGVGGYGMKQDDDILRNFTVAKITIDCDFEPKSSAVKAYKRYDKTENVLDSKGNLIWYDTEIYENEYDTLYIDINGNIITKDEYNKNGGHRCAFVSCTYHCG